MKKLILLPIFTFFCLSTFGQLKSAKVLDPQNWSQYVDEAYFTSAKINVTPQGAFANVEMEFEIGNDRMLSNGTQYEIEYLFRLPEGSIIHEAYLWMFGVQVKAKLYEKSEAKMIYESYVNRRTDPLIIYKTGNNYEARIYPLTTEGPRRFKICVLMPKELKNGKPTFDLPLDLFAKNAALENDMIVSIDHTTNWGNIENTNSLTLDSYDDVSTNYRVSKTADLKQIPKLTFENKIGDQLYVEYTGPNKGYFQVIMEDTLKNDDPTPQKYVFVLDIASNYSTINHRDFADLLKHHILENLNPIDQFNVVYGQNNLILLGSTLWSGADSTSVDQLFNNLRLNQQPKTSNTIKLIEFALERIVNKTNDHINLTIFSASNKVLPTMSALNTSINQLTQLNEGNCTINALEFYNVAEFTSWELWNFPELYINNAYFFYNLCIKNQGNYTTMVDPTNYWTQNTSVTSEDLMAEFFQSFGKNKTFVDYKYSADGILYHTVQPQRSKNLKLNSNFIITGEFINGIDDLSIDYFYQYNDKILSKKAELTPTEIQNSLTKKIWAGSYYNQLVNPNNSLTERRQIIDKSLEIEFLTDYTSFLALEPDTIEINAEEEDDLISIYEKKAPADIEVKAYPNPCNTYIVLETSLTTELKNQDYTITISDLSGKAIETISGNTMWDDKLEIRIDFTDKNLEAGIYFATVQIGQTKKTIRIVKY